MLVQQRQDAQQAKVAAIQDQLRGDTAQIMARYGTRVALANTASGTPAPPITAALNQIFTSAGKF